MNFALEFIETRIFTKQIIELLSDDEYRVLQEELIANPEKGDLITGTGGVRKLRFAINNKGKSGGIRVIYFLATKEAIYLLTAYPKSEKENLTTSEKAILKKLVGDLKKELEK